MAHDLVSLEGEVHFLDAVGFGARAERRLRARGAAAEQDAVASLHLCVSRASAIIAFGMDASGRRYRAGESLEDFCRVCKTDRLHTVIAADDEGRPIRVACGYCHSEHNYRGGPRISPAHRSAEAAPMPAARASPGRPAREPSPLVSDRERTVQAMTPDGAAGVDLEMHL